MLNSSISSFQKTDSVQSAINTTEIETVNFDNSNFNSQDSIIAEVNKIAIENVDKSFLNIDLSSYVILLVSFISISIILIYFLYKRKSKVNVLNDDDFKIKRETNFGNVFSGLADQKDAKKLRDKLIRKSHPDRFPNDILKSEVATEITALVTKHSYDLEKLKELENRIKIELEK